MSELKDYDIMDIEAMDDERLEKSESGKIQVTRVYIKSEADKVIADLKQKMKQQDVLLGKALNTISESHKHVVSLARKCNHANNKRCLAMADFCESQYDYCNAVGNGFWLVRGDIETRDKYRKKADNFWWKWHKRWLELAEQFKDAK